MRITLSKHKSAPVLTCTRSDGSTTYQKSPYGPFFGPHDLLHYVVETTLGLRDSFFGLIEQGHNIECFGERGNAAKLPLEALHTEYMVNQLMTELNFGEASSDEAFNATLADSCATAKGGKLPPPPPLTNEQLGTIRRRYAELIFRYRALKDGERLDLDF